MLKNLIIYLVVVFFGSMVIALFEWPKWIAFVFLFIAFLIMFGDFIYTLYGTTNMKKVEKLIVEKRKEPIYGYVYEQAFGTLNSQIEAVNRILEKYKQPHIQHYYRVIQSELQEDLDLALEEVEQIKKEPLMSYSKALIFAKMGKHDNALKLSENLPKKWMEEAILATVAKEQGDTNGFEHHTKNAISNAKGLQRYSLIHSFKQMRK